LPDSSPSRCQRRRTCTHHFAPFDSAGAKAAGYRGDRLVQLAITPFLFVAYARKPGIAPFRTTPQLSKADQFNGSPDHAGSMA
jgi:hypothetical protein